MFVVLYGFTHVLPQTDDTALIIMNHYYGIYTCDVTRKVIFSLFATLQPVSLELKSSRKIFSYQKLDNLLTIHLYKKLDLSRTFYS